MQAFFRSKLDKASCRAMIRGRPPVFEFIAQS